MWWRLRNWREQGGWGFIYSFNKCLLKTDYVLWEVLYPESLNPGQLRGTCQTLCFVLQSGRNNVSNCHTSSSDSPVAGTLLGGLHLSPLILPTPPCSRCCLQPAGAGREALAQGRAVSNGQSRRLCSRLISYPFLLTSCLLLLRAGLWTDVSLW